jgi:hypothetical protein
LLVTFLGKERAQTRLDEFLPYDFESFLPSDREAQY